MRAFEAFRLLLGLLCLNQFSQERLQASGHPQFCRTLRFYRGSEITQKSVGKTWCGSQDRKLLAVEEGVLFFLECSSGDRFPTKATAALLDARNATPATSIFEEYDLCEVVKISLSTGKNAGALARRLEGIEVPFDGSYCNARHYIKYLSTGKSIINMETRMSCPVFRKFSSRTKINSPKFKLSGYNSDYDWPAQKYGALTLSQTTRRRGSNNSMDPRLYSNTSSFRNFRLGYSKSLTQKNSRDMNTTNPQAIGHFSSSGGHGSSGGGHSTSGGRGSGSRGGGEEGGEGSSGGGGTRGNNYYGYGNGGKGRHSAGSKPAPWWGFKFPSFGFGYRPQLSG